MLKDSSLQVNVSEVLAHLRISGSFDNSLREVVERKVASSGAREAGVSVTDDELQSAFDVWRIARKLGRSEDMTGWMNETGLGIDEIENYLESTILVSKFKDKLSRECDIKSYIEHPDAKQLLRELVYADWLRRSVS